MVRNGHHQAREVVTAAGAVPVRAGRVNDKRTDEETGQRRRFTSAILPAWARRRGMAAPVLAVGDGALGFWKALREVSPRPGEQRCWWHYADLRIMPMWSLMPLQGWDPVLARSA